MTVVTIIDDDALLQTIARMIRVKGRAPTLEEIRVEVGWGSRSTAHRRVESLKAAGKLAGSGRDLRLTETTPSILGDLEDRTEALERAAQAAGRAFARRRTPDESHRAAVAGYERGWREGFRAALRADDPLRQVDALES
jgi:SOS-response transcriptional repressor LexA